MSLFFRLLDGRFAFSLLLVLCDIPLIFNGCMYVEKFTLILNFKQKKVVDSVFFLHLDFSLPHIYFGCTASCSLSHSSVRRMCVLLKNSIAFIFFAFIARCFFGPSLGIMNILYFINHEIP